MGVSTFTGLQTALRGLLAQQRALDVTSHNVANADTVGYSRQEAVLAASPALRIPAGAIQSGAGANWGPASTSPPTAACATSSSTSSTAPRRCGWGAWERRCAGSNRSKWPWPSPATPASPASSASSGPPGRTRQRAREPGDPPGPDRGRAAVSPPASATSTRSWRRRPNRPRPSTPRSPAPAAKSARSPKRSPS